MDMNIDFSDFTPPNTPNYAIVCPHASTRSDCAATAPLFSVSVSQLQTAWQSVIQQKPRITVLPGAPEGQFWYVQRTFFFRFPDYVTVHFYQVGENQSTVGFLSRSKYGYHDFGVNQKRVIAWLDDLVAAVKEKK